MTLDEYIISKFGETQGLEITKGKNEELVKADILYIGESTARRKTMQNKILPRIALYKALCNTMSSDEAISILWEYTKKYVCAPTARVYEKYEHIPGFFLLYKSVFMHIMKTSDKWSTDSLCGDKEKFGFTIHKCLWYDTCIKCGCPELCRIFCDSDWEMYKGMKKIKFSRTQTIGTGGEMCDFIFTRVK